MAKVKKATVALQSEVSNEEDWQELLERPGLIVVDVYSDWSGPCVAMIGILRKIKMEIAGEAINYAIAKNDEIEDLQRFRGLCEPVWMFLQNGKMVNLIFGADAPVLQRKLVTEFRRVQEGLPPVWETTPDQRGPKEDARWQKEEAVRKLIESKKKEEKEAREKEEYERFMTQMMTELSELMVVVIYPWVFKDEQGNQKIKMQCPAYTELVRDLLRQVFDVQEELRIQLDEETIKKMFVESEVLITNDVIAGLSDGKCMAIRLKSRPPPYDWPVPYPFECPDDVPSEKCPTRAINDVENYFHDLIDTQSYRKTIVGDLFKFPRESIVGTYMERYVYEYEADSEDEEDTSRVDPVIWAPFNVFARSKVHVFMTLFPEYMNENHHYELPKPPAPLCAFKYYAKKIDDLKNSVDNYSEAIVHLAAFLYDDPLLIRKIAENIDDFKKKVPKATTEVFVVVIRKINEEIFLGFAGINPYYATEKEDEVEKVIAIYFSEQKEVTDDYYYAADEAAEEEYYEANIYY
ncbi:TXND6 protein [Vespula squamosa]|uniref:TXND6 protein n=1 Tax=Vespula squamosa TaxID=30214 RepID=A0ABD2AED9_VESSQ